MSDEATIEELQAEAMELAQAQIAPWEPRCVARAFARRAELDLLPFTMQTWIDLEFARSPLLHLELPDGETEEEVKRHLGSALAAFGLPAIEQECGAEQTVAMFRAMREAIALEFSMRIGMRFPGSSDGGSDPGCGRWLPLLSCLVAQIGMPVREALAMRVGQAYALVAGHRGNQGCSPAGMSYAQRDVEVGGLNTDGTRTEHGRDTDGASVSSQPLNPSTSQPGTEECRG